MLTVPSAFANHQFSIAADRHVIVKVESGGSTWLFSDIDMNLAEGHVFPLVKSQLSIKQSTDFYTWKYILSSLRMSFENTDYLNSGNILSDEWGSILNATVTIYLAAGGGVTSLSDCLVRFIGVVVSVPEFNSQTVTLRAVDSSKINVVDLPQNLIGDSLRGSGVDVSDKKVPLVYGDFVKTFEGRTDTGLAVALIYNWIARGAKVVASDHVLSAITKMYGVVKGLPEVVEYLTTELDDDDNGFGTALGVGAGARVYIYPVNTEVANTTDASDGFLCLSTTTKTFTNTAASGGNTIFFVLGGETSGLMVGEFVDITGTTSYNGRRKVVSSASNFFSCFITFTTDQSGSFVKADNTSELTVDTHLVSNQDDSDYAEILPRVLSAFDLFAQAIFSFDNYTMGTDLQNDIGKITGLTAEIKVSVDPAVTLSGLGIEFSISWGLTNVENKGITKLTDVTGTAFNSVPMTMGAEVKQIDIGSAATIDGAPRKVNIPTVAHGFATGQGIYISGTNNYNYHHIVDSSSTTDIVRIDKPTVVMQINIGGAAVDIGGLPNEVDIPLTAHSLTTGNDLWITGTTNYNGNFIVMAGSTANFVRIVSPFNAENFVLASKMEAAPFMDETFTFNSKVEKAPNLPSRISWHWQSGHELVGTSGKDTPLIIWMQAITTAFVSSVPVFRVHEARVKVHFRLIAKPDTFFVECEGREYGSWITGRGSAYSDGDMIEDPAGIIESILRDEIGLVDAEIDMPSFIDAESSIKARVNYHSRNTKDSNLAIRELVEQSTFTFFYSSAGKAKLIDLSDTTPATSVRDIHPVVIPFSHIKKNSLKIKREPKLYNDITYRNRWQEEYRAYRDVGNVVDADSVSAYGTRTYDAKWKNVAGTDADAIAAFLVGPTGIWSNLHTVIDFEALGFTYSDLEVGDLFEISNEMDHHVKSYGVSWYRKQFRVTEVNQLEDSVKIEGIELFVGLKRLMELDQTVGLWWFNQSLLDETSNNNDLTADVSPVVYVNGHSEALAAITQESRIDSASAGDFDFGTGDFTIEGWFKLGNQTEVLIQKRNGSSGPGYRLIHFFVSGGTADLIRMELVTDAPESANVDSAGAAVTPGLWHYIAVVVDRSGNAQIYIDGVASGSPGVVSGWSGNITIASEDFKLRGQSTATIDDVCVTTRVLTQAELTERARA